jgi:hypothetical protein
MYPDGHHIFHDIDRDHGNSRLRGGSVVINAHAKRIVEAFGSEYIAAQVKQMQDAIEAHPTDAIGKAKELLESCCRTILKEMKIEVDNNVTVPQLVKKVCEELKLTPANIPDEIAAARSIKTVLGNLAAISTSISEMRNAYGTGHGKRANYKGLSPRHARLAVGTATTAVYFLWESFVEQRKDP